MTGKKREWGIICGGKTTFESKVVPRAPSEKPALDGSWLNFAGLNASEATEIYCKEENNNALTKNEDIAAVLFAAVLFCFTGIQLGNALP